MAHRHYQHADVGLVETKVYLVDKKEGDVRFVGTDDSLGAAGGAGGVEVDPRILALDLDSGLNRRGRSDDALIIEVPPRGLVLITDKDEPARPHLLKGPPDRFHVAQELLAADERLGIRVVDHVLDLGAHPAEVDGDNDHPRLGGGCIDLHVLHRVVEQDSNPVTFLESHLQPGIGQPAGLLVVLGEG